MPWLVKILISTEANGAPMISATRMSVMRSWDGREFVFTRLSASSAPPVFGMTYPRCGGQGLSPARRGRQRTLLTQLNLVGLQVVAVHFNTETRLRRQLEAAVRVVEWFVDEVIVFAQVPLRCFEFVEVGNRHHHLRSRNHVDWSRGVMWRDRDVIGFAQGGYLLEFGNAAGPGDVGHDVVSELVLEYRHEIPLRVAALAPRDGGTDLFTYLLEGIKALGRAGLLKPIDLARFLEAPTEANGGGNVEAAMRINENVDIGARRFADQGREFGGFAFILAGHAAIEVAVPPFAGQALGDAALVGERIELERSVSGLDDVSNFADDSLLAGEFALVGMGVERDFIAHRSAQQLVNRLSEDFAPDVPEGDIDGAHAFDGGAAAAHIGEAAENLVPEMLDPRWILACHGDTDLPQDRAESAVGEPCRGGDLSPAAHPLVGRNFDEQEFSPIRSI